MSNKKEKTKKQKKSIDWTALGLEQLDDNSKLEILEKEIQEIKMSSDDIVGLDGYTDSQRQEKIRKIIKSERYTKKGFKEMRRNGDIDKDKLRTLGIVNMAEAAESIRFQINKLSLLDGGIPSKTFFDGLQNLYKSSKALVESMQTERNQDERFDFQRVEVQFLVNWFLRMFKASLEHYIDKNMAEDVLMYYTDAIRGWEQKVAIEMKKVKDQEEEKFVRD